MGDVRTFLGASTWPPGPEIEKIDLKPRIVFLTIVEDCDYARAAEEMDASYVLRRRMDVDLVPAIKEALAGGQFSSPIPTQRIPSV